MKLTISLVCALTMLGFRAEIAWACECVDAKLVPAKKWIATFNGTVFHGTVSRIAVVQLRTPVPYGTPGQYVFDVQREITFKVAESWKGVSTSEIRIYTNFDDCASTYVEGKTYFVAATFFHERWVTSRCTDAGLDRKTTGTLGKGKRPISKNPQSATSVAPG
jgi:hypothetical protein